MLHLTLRTRLTSHFPPAASLILECPLCGGSIKNALMALHVERCNGVAPPATASTSAAWGKLLGANGRGGGARDGDSECVPLPLPADALVAARSSSTD